MATTDMGDLDFDDSMNEISPTMNKQSGMSTFVTKLYEMVQGYDNKDVICWVLDGTAFEIKDPKRLEREILPKFFRHSRFQSLIRQLNFYAFKKVSRERSSWVYCHDNFQLLKPELLDKLKRKTNSGTEKRMNGDTLVHSRKRIRNDCDTESETSHESIPKFYEEGNMEDTDEKNDYLQSETNVLNVYNWVSAYNYFDTSSRPTRKTTKHSDSMTFLCATEVDLLRSRLHRLSSSSMNCAVEYAVIFCLQRNPWKHSHSLFEEVYQLLIRNVDLVQELNGYYSALAPSFEHSSTKKSSSCRRVKARTMDPFDSSPSPSQDSDNYLSSFQGIPSEKILCENEITIMRTFMTFAVTALQTAQDILHDDNGNDNQEEDGDGDLTSNALKSSLNNCALAWWDYARIFI
eukprot:gene3996-7961_t